MRAGKWAVIFLPLTPFEYFDRACFRRGMLNVYGCGNEFRKVFPRDSEHRKFLFHEYSQNPFLDSIYNIYSKPASEKNSIAVNCQMYMKMGCAFVTQIDSSRRATSGWLKYCSDNEEFIKSNYLKPIEKTVGFIMEYTGKFTLC